LIDTNESCQLEQQNLKQRNTFRTRKMKYSYC